MERSDVRHQHFESHNDIKGLILYQNERSCEYPREKRRKVATVHSITIPKEKEPTGGIAVDDLPTIHMAAICCERANPLSPSINRMRSFL